MGRDVDQLAEEVVLLIEHSAELDEDSWRRIAINPGSILDRVFACEDRWKGFSPHAGADMDLQVENLDRLRALHLALVQRNLSLINAKSQHVKSVSHFTTDLELVKYHRGRGVCELHELARLVDAYFTGTARLTNESLGILLPANPGAEISNEGHKQQEHRLRKAYLQKR